MKDYHINISAPDLMNICVDSNEGGTIIARIYHKYSRTPFKIRGAGDMFIKMDRLMDEIDYPQSSFRERKFWSKSVKDKQEKKTYDKAWREEEMMGETGEKATFVVHIQYRQNATWQGEVVWMEGERKLHFRSALELLKMIDGAMELSEEEVKALKKDDNFKSQE